MPKPTARGSGASAALATIPRIQLVSSFLTRSSFTSWPFVYVYEFLSLVQHENPFFHGSSDTFSSKIGTLYHKFQDLFQTRLRSPFSISHRVSLLCLIQLYFSSNQIQKIKWCTISTLHWYIFFTNESNSMLFYHAVHKFFSNFCCVNR